MIKRIVRFIELEPINIHSLFDLRFTYLNSLNKQVYLPTYTCKIRAIEETLANESIIIKFDSKIKSFTMVYNKNNNTFLNVKNTYTYIRYKS